MIVLLVVSLRLEPFTRLEELPLSKVETSLQPKMAGTATTFSKKENLQTEESKRGGN
jgi:hypothetical protein